ncbi:histidine phosphatase family protein [Alkalicoccobacillus plakortidis]|uniref:Histidine phosphatase family protein n=1 Tax=Alkalicoccobacillus plakortidis TaxID=444060 RepID=A0ABT0XKT3_9BACI|nr:histidine phosphatase family protein [Alkalicoccobacillus plakortidis]MCM2676521.1 histidine phosphatase family protein [Alkalicoccobacillus plakortidis]
MKIGLVRHFKVTRGYPEHRLISSSDLIRWVKEYDESEVEENSVDLGSVNWKSCYSSDLPRARTTAETIYSGEINETNKLREINLVPPFKASFRLPLFLHLIMIRLAWLFKHSSQPENKYETKKRLDDVIAQAEAEGKDCLIVSHGGVMDIMRKNLRKRGYKGPYFKVPTNGKLYLFEK